ncbi:MAG TPA: amidohydrolase family protein [Anaerolineae bacterium]|nr:amidohydrolase family protein [Anaerolineae bacterium]
MEQQTGFKAVDVHAHFGGVAKGKNPVYDLLVRGSPEQVVTWARSQGIKLSFVSSIPALTQCAGQPQIGNAEAVKAAAQFPDALRFWATLNPTQPDSFGDVEDLLAHPLCVGIKIHPPEHQYEILEFGEETFSFAARRGTVIQTHSGDKGAWPMDFVPFADRFPNVRLILSHLGHGADDVWDHQVRAIEACKHRNIWTDTSSQMSVLRGLIEWAVGRIGPERILFGSDAPCYNTAAQLARIVHADLPEAAKRAILWDNAASLFRLSSDAAMA